MQCVLIKHIRQNDSYLSLSVKCLCGHSEMALLCRIENYQHFSRLLHFTYWCLVSTPVCLRGDVNLLTWREIVRHIAKGYYY